MKKVVLVKSYSLVLMVILITQLVSCASRPVKPNHTHNTSNNDSEKIGSPLLPEETPETFVPFVKAITDQVIDHKFFKIVYDPQLRLAKYVSYDLKSEDLKKKSFKRKDRFREDPFLLKMQLPSVKPSEYAKTGYDKGHLAPSADFSWDEKANDLTFVMSNMAPQKPGLNRDSWRRLEEKVRGWACGENHVTVITGPIIIKSLPRLKSGLVIPNEFFKIVIDQTPPRKFIAFVYQQSDKGDVLLQRSVPLQKIENATKLSFNKFFESFNSDEKRSPASTDIWKEAKCD